MTESNASSSPRVSVVIPCVDPGYLKQTLDSLAAQCEAPHFEVVVVDGSGGDVATRTGRWRDGLDLRVVKAKPHLRAGANRNIGVAASRASLILFIDADDTVGDQYVRAMADGLEAKDIVCSMLDYRSLNPWLGASSPRPQTDVAQSEMGFLPFAGAGTLGIRRPLFDRVGGFHPTLPCYEEAELCWRIQLAGHEPPFQLNDAILHVRFEPSDVRRWRKFVQYGATQVLLYRRFRGAGMPRASVREALVAWEDLAVRLSRRAAGRPEKGVGHTLAIRVGRLLGSIRHQVRYL